MLVFSPDWLAWRNGYWFKLTRMFVLILLFYSSAGLYSLWEAVIVMNYSPNVISKRNGDEMVTDRGQEWSEPWTFPVQRIPESPNHKIVNGLPPHKFPSLLKQKKQKKKDASKRAKSSQLRCKPSLKLNKNQLSLPFSFQFTKEALPRCFTSASQTTPRKQTGQSLLLLLVA